MSWISTITQWYPLALIISLAVHSDVVRVGECDCKDVAVADMHSEPHLCRRYTCVVRVHRVLPEIYMCCRRYTFIQCDKKCCRSQVKSFFNPDAEADTIVKRFPATRSDGNARLVVQVFECMRH